ncbi:MAG: DUF3329 domain-containing protein [Gammaproteobacteria bacterium]|nr:DUF3329 domain-containing protein [Gammaproteobacteria bacterium]
MSNRTLTRQATGVILRHAALLGIGYLIGALNQAPWIGISAALIGALTWHVAYRTFLQHWLQISPPPPIPPGSGDWPQIFARIQHFRNRSAAHKERSEKFGAIWQTFVDSLPDAAFVLNSEFEIQACNQRAADILAIDKSHLTGLISNYLRQPQLQSFLHNANDRNNVVITTPRAPDLTLRCRLSHCDKDHLLLQLLDISEQVQAQKMRIDFVANASHELRTPVTVLKGYLDSLVDDETLPGDLRQPVDVMNEQVNRMQELISDLMELNVLESGGLAPVDTPVNVATVLEGVHREAQASPHCPQDFRIEVTSDTGIYGSTSEFHSIVSNLVSNALRFTAAAGSVQVRWSTSPAGGELRVSDTGIGIDEAELTRITERFYRTEAGKARHQFGTGLGLAIVKHALARHESSLSISSEFGKGSVFTCTFPPHRLCEGLSDSDAEH